MNNYILELASKANRLSNQYHDAANQVFLSEQLKAANALAAVVDELVSAIADEAS